MKVAKKERRTELESMTYEQLLEIWKRHVLPKYPECVDVSRKEELIRVIMEREYPGQ